MVAELFVINSLSGVKYYFFKFTRLLIFFILGNLLTLVLFYRRMTILRLTSLLITFMSLSLHVSSQENGYEELQLTNDAFINRYSSYNKDGTKILFESNRDSIWQIYTMNADGTNQKRLIKTRHNDRRPTWHPYKDIILFESDRVGVSELYTYDLETKRTKRIPLLLIGNKTRAQFAPNGVQIIFNLEDINGDYDIYIVDHKGKRPEKIVDDAFKNLYPHFSPRGDNILFYSNKNNEGESDVIYTYNIITEKRSRLTYFKDHSNDPMWSNSRTKIAYVATVDNEGPEIYIMQSDGKNKKRITFNDHIESLPNWSPDDKNLLVTRYIKGTEQIFKILLDKPLEEDK